VKFDKIVFFSLLSSETWHLDLLMLRKDTLIFLRKIDTVYWVEQHYTCPYGNFDNIILIHWHVCGSIVNFVFSEPAFAGENSDYESRSHPLFPRARWKRVDDGSNKDESMDTILDY